LELELPHVVGLPVKIVDIEPFIGESILKATRTPKGQSPGRSLGRANCVIDNLHAHSPGTVGAE
jgi:hypothetical protein